MHFSVQQTAALAIALLSIRTIASGVKAEEGSLYKRDHATCGIEVSRVHARDFEPTPCEEHTLTVRTLPPGADDILDEIDEVLDSESDLVKGFVQKGGKKKPGH
jgi:ubiquitin-like protein Pup